MFRTAALLTGCVLLCGAALAAPPMVVVDENSVIKEEPAPHGAIGMTTAYRILHKGAAIGLHVMGHDEVYYVLSDTGEVTSDGVSKTLTAGMAAYLYTGSNSGLVQKGDEPLTIIISYPLPAPVK